jgi:alpha-maltose-1-phosphate synthase
MRIVVLSTDPGVPWGGTKGASVHLREMCGALAAQGCTGHVMVAGHRGDPHERDGVSVEELPCGTTAADRIARTAPTADHLRRRLRETSADAVYERFALHSAAGSFAASDTGIPHLVELNAPLPDEAARYRQLELGSAAVRLEASVLRSASIVFAVSTPLAAYAERRGAGRVEVLPNGVDTGRFRHPAAQRSERPVAIFAGRARPWHGLGAVATAWESLGTAAPRLRVIGDPGGAGPALRRLGAELIGSVEHERVPGLLCDADIGLAPYSDDAPEYFSPLKLFEYMAAGLAVIASDLPGVREVADPECAVLLGRGDDLGDAVGTLAADRDRRASLGSRARARAFAEHAWSRRARRVVAAAGQSLGVAG